MRSGCSRTCGEPKLSCGESRVSGWNQLAKMYLAHDIVSYRLLMTDQCMYTSSISWHMICIYSKFNLTASLHKHICTDTPVQLNDKCYQCAAALIWPGMLELLKCALHTSFGLNLIHCTSKAIKVSHAGLISRSALTALRSWQVCAGQHASAAS